MLVVVVGRPLGVIVSRPPARSAGLGQLASDCANSSGCVPKRPLSDGTGRIGSFEQHDPPYGGALIMFAYTETWRDLAGERMCGAAVLVLRMLW
jgi:hypothetical protein